MATRPLIGLLVIGLGAGILWAQEERRPAQQPGAGEATAAAAAEPTPAQPYVFKISDEDKARKNPVKFAEVSVERGGKLYTTQCAMCHGTLGDGKGEVVLEMNIKTPDFTKPEVLDKRTDGELFVILGMGSPIMPAQGTRMTDTHKWYLVNFVRSLSGKVPAKATGKEPEEYIILVPQ